MHRRLFIAAGALMLVIAACNPATGQTSTPIPSTHTLAPTPTPTRAPVTPEIFSPTAVPDFATPTPIVATSAPSLTPTLTSAPAAQAPCSPPAIDPAIARLENWLVYCDLHYGFGFRYPSSGTPADNSQGYERIFLPYKLGTNLGEKYLDVYVSEGVSTCESLLIAGHDPGTIPAETVSFNGITFIKQSGADAGAGNYYEWEAYSAMQGSLCASLNFVLHSTNRLHYETPPPEFDRAAEAAVFPTIVSTFYWFTP